MSPRQSLVDALRAALADRGDVRVALLFGSGARGDGDDASDVDVAVVAPGADLLDLTAHLTARLGRQVDVVSLASPSIPLLEEVLRDGVVVHSERGAAAQWRSTAWMMLETDRPGFARMRDAWLRHVAAEGIFGGQR